MTDAGAAVAAGWYSDPEDATQYRWWDGAGWTDHRTPVQQPAVAEAQPVLEAVTPVEPVVQAQVQVQAYDPQTPAQAQPQMPFVPEVVAAQPQMQAQPAAEPFVAQPATAFEPTVVQPEVTAAEAGYELPAKPEKKSKGGGFQMTRQTVMLIGLAVVVAVAGFLYTQHKLPGQTAPLPAAVTPAATPADGTTPAGTPGADTTGAAGTAVPKAVDKATGGGVGAAKDAAAAQNAAAAQADAAAGDAATPTAATTTQ